MTVDETGEVMDIIGAFFPEFGRRLAGGDWERMRLVCLWAEMFAGDDPRDVARAVKAFVATEDKGFAPSVGQIKRKIAEAAERERRAEGERRLVRAQTASLPPRAAAIAPHAP